MDMLETVARALARCWLKRQVKQPDDIEAAVDRIWRSHKGDGRAVIGAIFEGRESHLPELGFDTYYNVPVAEVDAALEDR